MRRIDSKTSGRPARQSEPSENLTSPPSGSASPSTLSAAAGAPAATNARETASAVRASAVEMRMYAESHASPLDVLILRLLSVS